MTNQTRSLILGAYTERLPHVDGTAPGIYGATLAGGRISSVEVLAAAVSPAWLVASRDRSRVYAVNETTMFGGVPGGGVSAYRRDADGGLTLMNALPSGGVEPAHLALDPSERFLVVANYRDGSVAVFALEEDGALGPMTDLVRHHGSSAHPVRQTSPHPHQVVFDPVSGLILVPDLGLDVVVRYALDAAGRLTEADGGRIPLPAGAGPRHLAFGRDAEHLYVADELDSTIAVFRRAGEGFELVQLLPSTGADVEALGNSASELAVSPSGRSVIVSNRGAHSLAVFRVEALGSLTPVGEVPSGGQWPRSFAFADEGAQLIVANQNSDLVTVFAFDEEEGRLVAVSETRAATAVSVLVL